MPRARSTNYAAESDFDDYPIVRRYGAVKTGGGKQSRKNIAKKAPAARGEVVKPRKARRHQKAFREFRGMAKAFPTNKRALTFMLPKANFNRIIDSAVTDYSQEGRVTSEARELMQLYTEDVVRRLFANGTHFMRACGRIRIMPKDLEGVLNVCAMPLCAQIGTPHKGATVRIPAGISDLKSVQQFDELHKSSR
jgi:histone H3/H4